MVLAARTLAGEKYSISGSSESVYRSQSASRSLSGVSEEVAVDVNEISRKDQTFSGMYS